MDVIRRAVLLAALAAGPARGADFEGILEGRVVGTHVNATYRATVGRDGVRARMERTLPEKEAKLLGKAALVHTSLWRRAEPDRTYLLDDVAKTYTVIEVPKDREPGPEYAVRRLGKDRVAGLPCEKVAIRRGEGRESEICVCSELSATGTLSQSMVREQGGLFAALHKAGVEGFPIRWKIHTDSGDDVMELVSAKRQRVPASTFAIPAGYREARHAGGPGQGGEEGARRREEALKKMSPEQRKKMEELLKSMGGK
ncbi:MAG TPA: DUF4412 domain-containing protein [Anaeromyxobacteraceae bacterium]|nr:DUF4412 domain-containing protein [Anaeromyxobacteraceae bacterium]